MCSYEDGDGEPDEDNICQPRIGCVDDTLIYQSITCGMLVNTNSEEVDVYIGGKFNEINPLVRTSIGEGDTAVIIDTQLLDLEENNLEWEYYSKEDIPSRYSEVDEISLSPQEEFICVK